MRRILRGSTRKHQIKRLRVVRRYILDLAVAAEPAQRLPIAATVSRELPVTEQPSLLIEHSRVMGFTRPDGLV